MKKAKIDWKDRWDEFLKLNKEHDDSLSPREFNKKYMGEWVSPPCSTVDNKGKHCPEEPIHIIKNEPKDILLCEECFVRYSMSCTGKLKAFKIDRRSKK